MAYLSKIELVFYKNHPNTSLELHPHINCFLGKNGSGKTNILDAIYYLCFARSYFTKTDKFIPYHTNSGFSVKGNFLGNEAQLVQCIYREDGKKELYIQQEMIGKTSAFIGNNSCVMIAPDDIAIINEGSEYRRRWMDTIFCQVNKDYLKQLQYYQKIITQRNALLKLMAEKNERNHSVLDYYNTELHKTSTTIHQYRAQQWLSLYKLITKHYQWIGNGLDGITIAYQSHLNEGDLLPILENNIHKDLATQRTNYGIHKDDLIISMDTDTLKNRASQGQKKSFLLALKMAELEWLTTQLNYAPMLLLDDIFERLDTSRISNLFRYITTQVQSQVFITDTDKQRVDAMLQQFTKDYKVLEITN